MGRILSFLVVFMLSLSAHASISISSVDSTASTCYNNGSITIHATGGSPPYSYSIISGPAIPNVTYPINNGQVNTFNDMHAGTYAIKITDQSGNTINVTVTVNGNYQDPVVTYATNYDTLFATGSLGKPPYQYALSSVSANSGFGAYQSSNVFAGLCNGTYYLRVIDSCQNFYTYPVSINSPALSVSAYCQSNGPNGNIITASTYGSGSPPFSYRLVTSGYTSTNTTGIFNLTSNHQCPDTVYVTDHCGGSSQTPVDCYPFYASLICSNFTDSTASIASSGGTLPYTFTFYRYIDSMWVATLSQDSGNFAHLPYDSINSTVEFGVVDACGRSHGPFTATRMKLTYSTPCPYNDTTTVSASGLGAGGTITCTNCNPMQTLNMPTANFYIPDSGNYTFHAVDGCGEIADTVFHVPKPGGAIVGNYTYISCNSVQAYATTSSGTPITTGVEYTLEWLSVSGQWDTVIQNTSGLFLHEPYVPSGNYRILYSTPGCASDVKPFTLPYFLNPCVTPFFDNQCNQRLIVSYANHEPQYDLPENYSLTTSTGVVYNEYPLGGYNGIYFNISPDTLILKSDSGCSKQQILNPVGSLFTYSTTHSCFNQNTVTIGPSTYCANCCGYTTYIYILQNTDTTYRDTSGVGYFTDIPPGTYHATVYIDSDSITMGGYMELPTGNAHCPLDTLTVNVLAHTIPQLNAHNVNVCGANTLANIPFTITGGFPPYTVYILGQSSVTTTSNTGTLPNIKPDSSYTMRVNDGCGVSNELAVTVIDTCDLNNCSFVTGAFSASDSSLCMGQVVSFQNLFTSGTTYVWTANGTVFSGSPNPTYTANTAGSITFKCVVTFGPICKDSSSLTIRVDNPPVFNLGSDTAYCGGFTKVLSTGVANTAWSTSATGASITVSAPGTYIATVNNNCGYYVDSVHITENPVPIVYLPADTIICTGDSATFNAYYPGATYSWSNSSTAESITVQQTGIYIVTAALGTCSTIDTGGLTAVTITASQLLPADTTLCSGRTVVLKPSVGTNPTWQDGSHDSTFTVTTGGTYTVTALTVCGTFTDSTLVTEHTTPVVNLGPDSLLCNGDNVILNASFANSSYTWNGGSHNDTVHVNEAGEYMVTVSSYGCNTTDSVKFETATVNPDLIPGDTTLCDGTTLILTPKTGSNPVWQDGSHSSTYTVSAPGLYMVTVNTICGDFSDSLKVAYEVCPSDLHVASAFSPNGDGNNDYFTVFGESIEQYEIKIFNRWGELVYDSRDVNELNNLSRGWDGTYKGKLQDPASFTYLIMAKGYDGKDYKRTGYVILIR